MADYNNGFVRSNDFTAVHTTDCVLVDEHGGNERPLADLLTNLEVDRDRYKRDLDELSRRHREEHVVVQKFIDFVKEQLAEGSSVVIESWADFDEVFEDFDGFDLERPRRDWSATVTMSVEVTLSGSAWATWDEDDIAESITESYRHDVDVNLRVDTDEVSGDDSYVEDWDIANVDVTFND
jgi:hypothetical protein